MRVQDLELELEAAKAANNSKSVFLANMSHEIRTPMNSIMGFLDLAMNGNVSKETMDYLVKIKTNAEWMLQIINDMRDITIIESGKLEMKNIPFDLHELFTGCMSSIVPMAVEKGIKLFFYAEPSVGKRPLSDPTRLRQVLVNLLSNAIKFTNTGIVKLHAALINMTKNNLTMHFEVKDSGIGMTGEQIERVLNPILYGGAGLGLTITKNIIESMGGKLLIESTPGVGSKFSFDLTFDTIDMSSDNSQENKIIFNDFEKPMFKGEILLCEDNEMNQEVICEQLARVGINTVTADNGKIGLETFQDRIQKDEKQFDMVFMDMHMPVMDGLEASEKIRKIDPKIPIIAVTANIMSDDMDIYKMSGINDCVGKPFKPQELWLCLMKYMTPVNVEVV